MSPVLLFVLLSLATYRVTRLIAKDTFPPVAKIRVKIVGEDALQLVDTRWEWFGELIACYWCAAVWVAGAASIFAWLAFNLDGWFALLLWPAVAAVASLTSLVEQTLEDLPVALVRRGRDRTFTG